jgi:hypothetical protein
MKLYTEEQVLEIIANINRDVNVSSQELLEGIEVYQVQLPNDEEIKKESKYKSNYILPQAVQFNPILNIVWIEGAIWMRDKIQGMGQ